MFLLKNANVKWRKFLYQKISVYSGVVFQERFFLCVSQNGKKKKKNCHEICCIIRYFRLQRRMLCQSFTEFTESRMFAGMNNETPGLLQYTYIREMDISATELSNDICQTQQNLI